MKASYWIKLYTDILRDPKMGRLPDRVWRRCIELFLLAGQEHDGGRLPALSDMAWMLRVSEGELAGDLDDLRHAGIVDLVDGNGWVVVNFAKRQAPATDAERAKRYRKRQSESGRVTKRDGAVTDMRHEVVTHTETETDTDTETEKRKSTRTRFVRPALEDVRAYCNERGIPQEADAFFDYYEANGWKVGKAAKPMKDWRAAVRNWQRYMDTYTQHRNGKATHTARTTAAERSNLLTVEQVARRANRALALLDDDHGQAEP